jgi:hypothetical protein
LAKRIPRYVRVVKFEQYQHGGASAKDLPWRKLYMSTLTDLALMSLSAASFKVWICLLLYAGRQQNVVQTDCKTLTNAMHMRAAEVTKGLQDLLEIGLIEPCVVSTKSRNSLEKVSTKSSPSRAREDEDEDEEKSKASNVASYDGKGPRFKIPKLRGSP